MSAQIIEAGADQGKPSRLVRHQGRIVALSELSGSEIAKALPRARQAEIRAALGISNAKSASAATPRKGRVEIVIDALANDPKCLGKTELALQLLRNDDLANLSGEVIVQMLGHAESRKSDPEAAARAEMKAALARQGNSNICPDGGRSSDPRPAGSVWDAAGRASFGEEWGK